MRLGVALAIIIVIATAAVTVRVWRGRRVAPLMVIDAAVMLTPPLAPIPLPPPTPPFSATVVDNGLLVRMRELPWFAMTIAPAVTSASDTPPLPVSLLPLTALISEAERYIPAISRLLRDKNQLQVMFSPEVGNLLRDGTAVLMQSGGLARPIAMDVASGRTVGLGIVVGGSAIVSIPAVAVMTCVIASSWVENARLENVLKRLLRDVSRVEDRLVAADRGTVRHGDELAHHALHNPLDSRIVTVDELLATTHELGNLRHARQVTIERFLGRFARAQAGKTEGEDTPTAARLDRKAHREISEELGRFLEDVNVYLEVAIVHSRVEAAIAWRYAVDGRPGDALSRLQKHEVALRTQVTRIDASVTQAATFSQSWYVRNIQRRRRNDPVEALADAREITRAAVAALNPILGESLTLAVSTADVAALSEDRDRAP